MAANRHGIRQQAKRLQQRGAELAAGLSALGLSVLALGVVAASSGGTAAPDLAKGRVLALASPVALAANRAPEVAAEGQAEPQAEPSPLHRFTAPAGADLSESLRLAGVPAGIARDYVTQMLRVPGFASEISVADRFDLVVARFPGEEPVLVYAGMDRVGRGDLQFLKYGDEHGRIEWVDARGLERRESAGVLLPVGGRITSGFGTRMHPLLHRLRFHRGVDLAAPWGAPIRAAADGRVIRSGWRGGYGWQIALAHGGGLDTSYSHLSRMLVHAGETVRRGQIIGRVGSSGLSTGPHVHFEATKGGRAIDPRSVHIDAPVAFSRAQREAFNGQLRTVLTISGA